MLLYSYAFPAAIFEYWEYHWNFHLLFTIISCLATLLYNYNEAIFTMGSKKNIKGQKHRKVFKARLHRRAILHDKTNMTFKITKHRVEESFSIDCEKADLVLHALLHSVVVAAY